MARSQRLFEVRTTRVSYQKPARERVPDPRRIEIGDDFHRSGGFLPQFRSRSGRTRTAFHNQYVDAGRRGGTIEAKLCGLGFVAKQNCRLELGEQLEEAIGAISTKLRPRGRVDRVDVESHAVEQRVRRDVNPLRSG